VGREFPVFLHPQSNEEYALARLERKSGRLSRVHHRILSVSHAGAGSQRRDLRSTRCARGGRHAGGSVRRAARSRTRLLRHVSEAFVEDPVRILRVRARREVRAADLDFAWRPRRWS
jgi:tRNA nucleotidyltransferase (CCA-adding enzyme)